MQLANDYMTYDVLSTAVTAGYYISFLAWTILVVLLLRQILKRDITKIKILSLYLFNSVTFLMAWGLILKLALIVRPPGGETKEKAIDILRIQADKFMSDFILYSLVIAIVLTVINVLYLHYFAKVQVLKHALTMFIANLAILLVASYISTAWYYHGLLQEIDRHFNPAI